jgi:hypothetical protein
MIRPLLIALLFVQPFGSSLAQSAFTPLYKSTTLPRILEVIGDARREMWLIAPTLREERVYRVLRSRLEAGVKLRLLITNRAGFTAYERFLIGIRNVDARWIKERLNASMIVVDDQVVIVSPLLSGVTGSGPNIEVSRPEVIAPMTTTLKQLFQTARRVR